MEESRTWPITEVSQTMKSFSSLLCRADENCSLSLSDLLLRILDLVGHLTLVDLELDLALVLQLGEDHESLIIFTIVDESAYLID